MAREQRKWALQRRWHASKENGLYNEEDGTRAKKMGFTTKKMAREQRKWALQRGRWQQVFRQNSRLSHNIFFKQFFVNDD